MFLIGVCSINIFGQKCDESGSIVSVRTTHDHRTESVVFRVFATDPQFTVSTVRPPFYLGESDQKVTVKGVSHRAIQFNGIIWTCVIEGIRIRPRIHLAAVKNTYQFEGDVVYTVGLKRGVRYKGVTTRRIGDHTEVEFRFGK